MAIELVRLIDVKDALDMPSSESGQDNKLTRLIKAVSTDFEKSSGRKIDKIERTIYFDIESGQRTIYLPAWPVDTEENFKIYQDTSRAFGDDTEVDSDFYYLDADTGIIDLFQAYPICKKSIKIVFTAGMAVLTSPVTGSEFWNLYPDISEAIIHEIVTQYKQLPSLGASTVRIKGDTTEINKPVERTKAFLRAAEQYSRMII